MKRIRQGQTRWENICVNGGELSDLVTIYTVRMFALRVTHRHVICRVDKGALTMMTHTHWRSLFTSSMRAMRSALDEIHAIDRSRTQDFCRAWDEPYTELPPGRGRAGY